MAYENFKPIIWSKYIQTQLAKTTVLQDICNTKFQGEIGPGKTVKIIGAGRPTVATYTPGSNISAASTPPDTSIFLAVDQYNYTHFIVDDVDEAQGIDGMMEAYMQESTRALAEARDLYIATAVKDAKNASATSSGNSTAEARTLVDAALQKLWENGVNVGDNVNIVVTPWFYQFLKASLTAELTANVDMIKNGKVGMYSGATVRMSNNLYNDATDDYMIVCTDKALAFAGGIHSTEAYRPDLQFGDAIKMLDCFGAKIVRTDELYVIKAHNS